VCKGLVIADLGGFLELPFSLVVLDLGELDLLRVQPELLFPLFVLEACGVGVFWDAALSIRLRLPDLQQ
jgi:hypothetical protein